MKGKLMTPKGNRTHGKDRSGGAPRIGGFQSKGSDVKPIRFSVEMIDQIEERIEGKMSFSDFVRMCVKTELEKDA
jgi:hypothetical protein